MLRPGADRETEHWVTRPRPSTCAVNSSLCRAPPCSLASSRMPLSARALSGVVPSGRRFFAAIVATSAARRDGAPAGIATYSARAISIIRIVITRRGSSSFRNLLAPATSAAEPPRDQPKYKYKDRDRLHGWGAEMSTQAMHLKFATTPAGSGANPRTETISCGGGDTQLGSCTKAPEAVTGVALFDTNDDARFPVDPQSDAYSPGNHRRAFGRRTLAHKIKRRTPLSRRAAQN